MRLFIILAFLLSGCVVLTEEQLDKRETRIMDRRLQEAYVPYMCGEKQIVVCDIWAGRNPYLKIVVA